MTVCNLDRVLFFLIVSVAKTSRSHIKVINVLKEADNETGNKQVCSQIHCFRILTIVLHIFVEQCRIGRWCYVEKLDNVSFCRNVCVMTWSSGADCAWWWLQEQFIYSVCKLYSHTCIGKQWWETDLDWFLHFLMLCGWQRSLFIWQLRHASGRSLRLHLHSQCSVSSVREWMKARLLHAMTLALWFFYCFCSFYFGLVECHKERDCKMYWTEWGGCCLLLLLVLLTALAQKPAPKRWRKKSKCTDRLWKHEVLKDLWSTASQYTWMPSLVSQG